MVVLIRCCSILSFCLCKLNTSIAYSFLVLTRSNRSSSSIQNEKSLFSVLLIYQLGFFKKAFIVYCTRFCTGTFSHEKIGFFCLFAQQSLFYERARPRLTGLTYLNNPSLAFGLSAWITQRLLKKLIHISSWLLIPYIGFIRNEIQ